MTTFVLRTQQEHPEPHFDSASFPANETPEHQSVISETDQKQGQEDELSAEFIAECERLGVPLSVARKVQRRNQAKHDYYWRDMQMAVSKAKGDGSKDGGVVGGGLKSGGGLKTLRIADDMVLPIRRTSAADVSSSSQPPVPQLTEEVVESAHKLLRQTKDEALEALRSTQGDTTNPRFLAALKSLSSLYRGMRDQPGADGDLSKDFEGCWTMVSKPNFRDGLGPNRRGDFVYTLGRMAFGMFRPTELRCSIQRIVNTTSFVGPDDDLPDSVPNSLKKEIHDLREAFRNSGTVDVGRDGEGPILRTYDIEVDFSIEPNEEDDSMVASGRRLSTTSSVSSASSRGGQKDSYPAPSKPLRAKMITQGFLLPDPEDKDRLTVWFTGGTIMPVRETGEEEAEKSKRKAVKKKKKKAKGNKSGSEEEQAEPSLSSIKESLCQECDNACPLLLHECRRENKQCHLHGQKKLSKEYRHKMKARVQKYVRPKAYGIYVPHKTGLSVGDMVDAPFDSEWEEIFARDETWKKSWSDSAKLLAAKMLLGADLPQGMDADGSMTYSLHRPIGGHGTTYVDVLYLDDNLRITRGNAGSIFVQVKENHASSSSASTPGARQAVQSGQVNPAA